MVNENTNITSSLKKFFVVVISLICSISIFSSLSISEVSAASSQYIGEAKARAIALSDAGQTQSNVRIVKSARYTKKRQPVYGIIFLTSTKKYSYEIDARTGDIVTRYVNNISGSGSSNNKTNSTSSSGTSSSTSSNKYIGTAKAKSIALAHAKVSASNIKDFEIDLDRDNGKMVYEIEFEYNDDDYEYIIDANTGKIISWERD